MPLRTRRQLSRALMSTLSSTYTGRFAPSPTGPLHFGSLIAAVASYLDARANHGRWLVRMEDLDPAREVSGAADIILQQLEDFGLTWDDTVMYQSRRLGAYHKALIKLRDCGLVFQCDCSRQQVRAMGKIYDGRCRQRFNDIPGDHATRIRVQGRIAFEDLVQGPVIQNLETEVGDFIIRRRDGLFAYQLAVVVDDAFQKVSHVIRGYDLLDSTPRQIYLQRKLDFPVPAYGHVPIVTNEQGQKLSKQHYAEPISSGDRRKLLHASLTCLGLKPPDANRKLPVSSQLDWAVTRWDIQAVPKLANIPLHELPV